MFNTSAAVFNNADMHRQCRARSREGKMQQKTFRLRLCSGSLSREVVRLSRPSEQGRSESRISVALRFLARHKEVT